MITMIPCSFLLIYNLNNMRQFYRERIQIYQSNELNLIETRLNDIVRQTTQTADEVIGSLIISHTFEDYSDKNEYEKLLVLRELKNQMSNMVITNRYIDHIYMVTFDGKLYSSNVDVNEQAYFESMDRKINIEQKGEEFLEPTHQAKYRKYQNSSKSWPYVISYKKYLNKYTPGNEVGLIQVDISWQTVAEAVSSQDMTAADFVYILDSDNHMIYSPNKEDLEKSADEVSVFSGKKKAVMLSDIVKALSATDTYYMDSYTFRTSRIDQFNWKIIQVNSDSMLRSTTQSLYHSWILIAVICVCGAFILAFILSLSINRSIVKIINYMLHASEGNFEISTENLGNNEFARLADAFNTMIEHIDSLMKENISKEHERTTMELMALNSKINSHFLYNTLNLIKLLAIKNRQMDIAHIIVSLSGILEYSYKNTDSLVPLCQEIEFTQNYLYIQTVRFNKKVTVNYQIPDEVKECRVPKMVLQPVVENSFLHAFRETGGNDINNIIDIKVEKKGEQIQISITDNGQGFHYVKAEQLTGVGLKNVIQRMNIFFAERFSYTIESEIGKGTKVMIRMPLIDSEKEESHWKR